MDDSSDEENLAAQNAKRAKHDVESMEDQVMVEGCVTAAAGMSRSRNTGASTLGILTKFKRRPTFRLRSKGAPGRLHGID